MPTDLDQLRDEFVSLPRSLRRRISRDTTRHYARPGDCNGSTADRVHARPAMPHRIVTPRSGQLRVNAKRNQRAEFWRTVRIRVHPDSDRFFAGVLALLGDGARVVRRTIPVNEWAIHYDVHIPSAPAEAVEASPVWLSERLQPVSLRHIDWYDADGKRIEVADHAMTSR